MMQEVSRRNYIGDDGLAYVVVEMKPVLTTKPIDGPAVTGYGTSEFRLEGNGLLYDKDNDCFEIATTGVMIRPA